MKMVAIALTSFSLLAAGAVQAQPSAELMKAKGCLNCHEAEKKKIGPSFKDIAAKYQGNKDAAATLAAKLKEGKGHPKVEATDKEVEVLVGAVLTGK